MYQVAIINVNDDIKRRLKESNFSLLFLNNCLNSKFLSIEEHNSKIVGVCFVGGLLNSNGIEIQEEFRGKGIGKKLLNEILLECKKRDISFMVGVFKPSNAISIKTHMNLGYRPVFTFHYNKEEGKEIVVILPFNSKGFFLMKMLKFFNTKIGNMLFGIIFRLLNPILKDLIAFSGDEMPKIDLLYSIKNFEKVEKTLSEIDTKVQS